MAKLAERDQIQEAEEHCFYMTQHVATLPYRAPELLFVMPEHSTAVDIWATGCIFAEMILRRELFPGRSVSGQIKIVVGIMGSPPEKVMKCSEAVTRNYKIQLILNMDHGGLTRQSARKKFMYHVRIGELHEISISNIHLSTQKCSMGYTL